VITVPLPDGSGRKTVKLISMDRVSDAIDFDNASLQPTLREVRK
jgi:hypothetical protein